MLNDIPTSMSSDILVLVMYKSDMFLLTVAILDSSSPRLLQGGCTLICREPRCRFSEIYMLVGSYASPPFACLEVDDWCC